MPYSETALKYRSSTKSRPGELQTLTTELRDDRQP